MEILKGLAEQVAIQYMKKTAETAGNATCLRDKCGSIIVKENKIIGIGFNSPPYNLESQRRCNNNKSKYDEKVKDKTCCIHAEQRAVMDALIYNKDLLVNSALYFTRIDATGNIIISGEPYCTICSKITLDSGIKEFVLWQDKRIVVYNTEEYNDLSFKYKKHD